MCRSCAFPAQTDRHAQQTPTPPIIHPSVRGGQSRPEREFARDLAQSAGCGRRLRRWCRIAVSGVAAGWRMFEGTMPRMFSSPVTCRRRMPLVLRGVRPATFEGGSVGTMPDRSANVGRPRGGIGRAGVPAGVRIYVVCGREVHPPLDGTARSLAPMRARLPVGYPRDQNRMHPSDTPVHLWNGLAHFDAAISIVVRNCPRTILARNWSLGTSTRAPSRCNSIAVFAKKNRLRGNDESALSPQCR